MHNAWTDGEQPLVDERQFTPWAEPGWDAWNPFSAELWFCETAAKIAEHKGGLVIETGAGQGYTTRRVAEYAEEYHVYEAMPTFRNSITGGDNLTVATSPTPEQQDIEQCSLLIIDSNTEYRMPELKLWNQYAPKDSLVLMHDAGNGHENHGTGYTHLIYWRMVQELGLTGIRYRNPRGAFLGWKDEPADLEFYLSLGPNEYPNF